MFYCFFFTSYLLMYLSFRHSFAISTQARFSIPVKTTTTTTTPPERIEFENSLFFYEKKGNQLRALSSSPRVLCAQNAKKKNRKATQQSVENWTQKQKNLIFGIKTKHWATFSTHTHTHTHTHTLFFFICESQKPGYSDSLPSSTSSRATASAVLPVFFYLKFWCDLKKKNKNKKTSKNISWCIFFFSIFFSRGSRGRREGREVRKIKKNEGE